VGWEVKDEDFSQTPHKKDKKCQTDENKKQKLLHSKTAGVSGVLKSVFTTYFLSRSHRYSRSVSEAVTFSSTVKAFKI